MTPKILVVDILLTSWGHFGWEKIFILHCGKAIVRLQKCNFPMCDQVTARVSILKRDHDGIGIEKQDYNSGLKTHAVSEHWKVWLRT